MVNAEPSMTLVRWCSLDMGLRSKMMSENETEFVEHSHVSELVLSDYPNINDFNRNCCMDRNLYSKVFF